MTRCYTLSIFSSSVLKRPHIKNTTLPSFIRLRESHSKMSENIYGNVNTDRTWDMDRRTKIRSSRAAAVCLLLLCVFLLTAVIVLCVHQYALLKTSGWFHSDFSFYFMSSMKKSWDESRRYCTERGADLIIINSREKQDFVTKITDKREFWIGVTDIVEEGTWKWVDGTSVTSGEPNGGKLENCAVTYLKKNPELIGWIDVNCNGAYQWICEKSSWF
uniref:C-type lectin domain-containing protein n=1 Tax=Cyprinus carpio TaxID=7962 RepID=A0A8C2HEE6_CYPCA